MRAAFAALIALLALPAVALAVGSGAVAVANVYFYDSPEPAVSLAESDGTLVCSWGIKDLDVNDSFTADVSWSRDGTAVSTENVDCGQLRNCAALERPKPAVGENWNCAVTVRDSYGASGEGSAEFQLTPLSFFGGLLRSVFSFFKFG